MPTTHVRGSELLELPANDLQRIANHILSEVESVSSGIGEADKNLVSVKFVDGITLSYPKWLIKHRGHDLYAKFQYKYKKAVNHENLIKALVRHELIPLDLVEIFQKIQQ